MLMLIGFILGTAAGLGAKIILDKYHEFKTEEQRRADKMEQLLINWQAIAKIKELDK